MIRIKSFINNLSKFQKITYSIIILFLLCALPLAIPTLSRYKNRNILDNVTAWDGSIATSYRKGNGTINNPYVISNGSELAYFSEQLKENNYEDTYFVLGNDIIINNGIFTYNKENKITYILNDQTYYVDEYTGKYYDNSLKTGTEIGTINKFNSLDGFKGTFDGKSYRIFGLYIADEEKEELGLFTSLNGDITDLYVENTIIYGGIVTGGIASNTTNANISNILFNGYVIGKTNISEKNINLDINVPLIALTGISEITNIDLTNNIPFVGSEIFTTSITGEYSLTNTTEENTSIEINGTKIENGIFNIDLGNSILDNIDIIATSTDENATLTLTNVKYNISYKYSVIGGIVGKSNNTILENVINKANIYGYTISGGLVGVTTNLLSINQSYNIGEIESSYLSGGLVGVIEKSEDNIFISKSYNTGSLTSLNTGGLIGTINNNTGSVSINNVFDLSNTYAIETISNTLVSFTNCYSTSLTPMNNQNYAESFIITTRGILETKNFGINNLIYNEFIDYNDLLINSNNVWIYEDNSLPILFIDDSNNPIANIHVGTYLWNNLSYDLKTIKFKNNITFSIDGLDPLNVLIEKEYYVSDKVLTKEEVSNINSLNQYEDVVQLTDEGFYVIYVKVKDSNNNIKILNTDLLVLDLTGANIKLNINNYEFTTLETNLKYAYVDRLQTISIDAEDRLSGIESINYYITNEVLDKNELDKISDNNWINYSEAFENNEQKTYIVYAKVVDKSNYITYVNSDYIVYDGYTQSDLIIGKNESSYLNATNNITNKSTITLNYRYEKTEAETTNNTHNLISNILLPLGTKITLIDKINSKVYEYKIITSNDDFNYNNSCDSNDTDCVKKATYPFTLFTEKGTGTTKKYYTESSYYNDCTISENFNIIIDLSATNNSNNYENVSLYMELHNGDNVNIRPTLHDTIKQFNIYSTVNNSSASATLNLTTNYNGDSINFNSNSTTNINLVSNINYKNINELRINDTTYENKEIGLQLKIVDNHGLIVDDTYLKNIIVKIGTTEYYPGNDNKIHINLNNGINDTTKTITIITKENNADLKEGLYYLKISNYVANDGIYYDNLSDVEISIPVNIISTYSNKEYSFNINMSDANRIINKSSSQVTVPFSIEADGTFQNPNLKVSLYKKNELTAYNQDYSLVDLNDYISDNLEIYEENVYYISNLGFDGSNNSFNLNLIPQNFENTGYKFVFDLYEGTKKIGTLEKLFIIK